MKNNLTGGGGNRVIPKFVDSSNTAFKSQDTAKSKYTKKPNENPKNTNFQNNNDLVSVKISKDFLNNQVPQYRQIYPAPYIPVKYPMPQNNAITAPFAPQSIGGAPHFFTANNVPVINNYKIETGGINANHYNIDNIYEEILPIEIRYSSFDSTRDRFMFYTYIRSTFITFGDGEYINIDNNRSNMHNTFNLLDKVKLMEFNPYNFNKFTANPYRDLSDRMLIYRSCYPMKFNKTTSTMRCDNNNINLNIKIYDMNVGEVCAKRISQNYDWNRFDLWREIGFYEYIREKIIRKNICPHFPILFAYYVTNNKKINFKKFRELKKNYTNPADIRKNLEKEKSKDKQILQELFSEIRKLNTSKNSVLVQFLDKNSNKIYIGSYVVCNNQKNNTYYKYLGYVTDIIHQGDKYIIQVKHLNGSMLEDNIIDLIYDQKSDEDNEFYNNWLAVNEMDMYLRLLPEQRQNMNNRFNFNPRRLSEIEVIRLMRNINPSFSSNKCLIAITEAYNYPIRLWASRLYEKDLHITNKMIHTGFHSDKVWASILFQLVYTLGVMYHKSFTINNINLDNNIFIKYINKEDSKSGYWKYTFNDIDYYIPNYGYIVIIDTNYKDLGSDTGTLSTNNKLYQKTHDPKIWSDTIFKVDDDSVIKNEEVDNNEKIKENLIKSMLDIFNIENFISGASKQYGGIEPPENIKTLFTNLHNYIRSVDESSLTTKDFDFNKLLLTNFSNFLHNRIGDSITKEEIEYIEKHEIESNPKLGKLYVSNENKIILYSGIIDEKKSFLKDRKKKIGIENKLEDFESIGIRNFDSRYLLEQNYKLVDEKFTSDNLLDSYYFKI